MKYRVLMYCGVLFLLASGAVSQAQNTQQVEPLKAQIERTFQPPDQTTPKTETGAFYRDAQGRARIEHGKIVDIIDPVAHTKVVLNTEKKTARRITLPSDGPMRAEVPGGPGGPGMGPGGPGHGPGPDMACPEITDLGSREIEGITATGTQITVTMPPPPDGDDKEVTVITKIWQSSALRLMLSTERTDSLGGKFSENVSKIQRNATIDPAVFAVPADYTVTDVKPCTPPDGAQKGFRSRQ